MTYAKRVLSVPVQVSIEQALAAERSVGWICDRYGVTADEVAAVDAYLEQVNGEPDEAHYGRPAPDPKEPAA